MTGTHEARATAALDAVAESVAEAERTLAAAQAKTAAAKSARENPPDDASPKELLKRRDEVIVAEERETLASKALAKARARLATAEYDVLRATAADERARADALLAELRATVARPILELQRQVAAIWTAAEETLWAQYLSAANIRGEPASPLFETPDDTRPVCLDDLLRGTARLDNPGEDVPRREHLTVVGAHLLAAEATLERREMFARPATAPPTDDAWQPREDGVIAVDSDWRAGPTPTRHVTENPAFEWAETAGE